MIRGTVIWLLLLMPAGAMAAEPVKFAQAPTVAKVGGKTVVSFAVSAATDVEVAIIDAKGVVVRHLAAGVLGGKVAPPAPLKPGLSQTLEWDGKDDYEQPVAEPAACSVRVRVGMGVKLEQIAGGTPYMYFLGSHGDHGRWGLTGVGLKLDGKVYVVGHSSTLGPVAIRQYDVDGNYQRTVFPPPAGKDPEAMKGWGIHVKPDGTYTVRYNRLTDPSVSLTLIDPELGMARMMPTPDPKTLVMWNGMSRLVVNTDGTIPPPSKETRGRLVEAPPLGPRGTVGLGPVFTCMSPDGTFYYLSGFYAAGTLKRRRRVPVREGFWLDGQVWKVDVATRKATPFFALDKDAVVKSLSTRRAKWRQSSLGGNQSYAALHGVAVDDKAHVFVANRLDNCVLVLDKDAKIIRKVPVKYPDAVAVSTRTGALYVTTRCGCEHTGAGQMGLVKFDSWEKDDKPSVILPKLAHTWYTSQHKHSYVVLCEKEDVTNVWVAYTELPVNIYEDDGKDFKLVKNFRKLTAEQGCIGFDRMAVDRQTETVYVGNNHSTYWRVSDWAQPKFSVVPVRGASVEIDSHHRYIYANPGGSVWIKNAGIHRYDLDKKGCPPAKAGNTHRLTNRLWSEWCFTGNSDLGFGVAPNGNIAGFNQKGQLLFFHGSEEKAPWASIQLARTGGAFGCIKFDLAGNLYAGMRYGKSKIPPVFKGDRFAGQGGRGGCAKIVRFAPTGELEGGNLFPKAPAAPDKVYEVNFGAFDSSCIRHTARFDLDPYGRILYPTNIEPSVTLIDNTGNQILRFGTWGNRDSMGGLDGDRVPTKDIPMALPNSVGLTDDYIYVADAVNLRILRIAKTFSAEASAKVGGTR